MEVTDDYYKNIKKYINTLSEQNGEFTLQQMVCVRISKSGFSEGSLTDSII